MKRKHKLKWVFSLLVLIALFGTSFMVMNVPAESYVLTKETQYDEKELTVVDCDYMSEFIYQQGGMGSADEYAVTVMSSEETEGSSIEGAKEAILNGVENLETEID